MKFYQGTTIGFRSSILVVTSWEPLEVRWDLLRLQSCKIRVKMTKQFQGSDNGKFNYPWGICTDSLGFIYVCDKENHRIQVFVFFWNISHSVIVIFLCFVLHLGIRPTFFLVRFSKATALSWPSLARWAASPDSLSIHITSPSATQIVSSFPTQTIIDFRWGQQSSKYNIISCI